MRNPFKREKVETRSFDEIVTLKCEETVEKTEEAEVISKSEEEIKCNALDCFGIVEGKTDNVLIKCANIWYLIASFLWFIVGCLTFAPVIFLQSKVNVIFKNKKKSLMCAILTHFCVIALIVILIIMR